MHLMLTNFQFFVKAYIRKKKYLIRSKFSYGLAATVACCFSFNFEKKPIYVHEILLELAFGQNRY